MPRQRSRLVRGVSDVVALDASSKYWERSEGTAASGSPNSPNFVGDGPDSTAYLQGPWRQGINDHCPRRMLRLFRRCEICFGSVGQALPLHMRPCGAQTGGFEESSS
jgi:hypothetical protein